MLYGEAIEQFPQGIALGHPWQKTGFLSQYPCPYRQASFLVAKEELGLQYEEIFVGAVKC